MTGKKDKPMNARERMAEAAKGNTGESAEILNPITDRLKNNSESDEVIKLKKQLEDSNKELARQKKLAGKVQSVYMLVAPSREVEAKSCKPYPARIHSDNLEFLEEHTKGSHNIIINFLMRQHIKIIKTQLKDGTIKIDSNGNIQIDD